MDIKATLGNIRRTAGVAGQVKYSVPVTYEGEAPQAVQFVGSIYGGPVLMITPGNPRGTWVTDPSRFGLKFSPDWVRAFFA